jgi:hypothetical protein
MKKLALLALSSALILTSGCHSTLFISDAHRLSGEWVFSEVKYTKLFSFRTVDVTPDYYAWQITFMPDKTLTAYNSYLQHAYSGRWQIRQEVNNDYENNMTTTKVMDVFLKAETASAKDTSFVLNKLSLTKKKIYGTNSYDKKSYTIRMIKH